MVRRLTQELGFSLVDQTKMVTAASELARNALVYGGGGRMKWELLDNGGRRGLKLTFSDEGPGIANVEIAMTEIYAGIEWPTPATAEIAKRDAEL